MKISVSRDDNLRNPDECLTKTLLIWLPWLWDMPAATGTAVPIPALIA